MIKEKRPRQYFDEIRAMPRLEDRRAALAKIPEDKRELVKAHLSARFELRKANRG